MIGFLAAIVLLWVSVYIFIPNIISLKSSIVINATRPGIHRMLLDKSNVARWWPGKTGNDSFYLDDFSYKINNGNITVLPISINGQNTNVTSSLFLISSITDSTQLVWVGSIATSYNPVKRFLTYLEAKKIHHNMITILQKMENFYSKPENIYGIEIKKTLVADSLLIATSARCKGYPTTPFIYSLVDKLRKYAIINSAKETGYPMLNVSTADSIQFDVKVAIPTDKILPSSGDILQKRMLGRGDILITEIKGGTSITTQALAQVHNYAEDYHRIAPAIPFYSLITDRTKEPDSNKWITKIYFPIR